MIQILQPPWFLPFLLYAETHYRFRYFLSYLRKREPEIIADAPFRMEPGHRLPVLVLVKDAHRWPCTLKQVTIGVRRDGRIVDRHDHLDEPLELNGRILSHVFWLDVSALEGWIELDVAMTIEQVGSVRIYYNDNHRTSTRHPLKVFVSRDPLPRFPEMLLGDPHTHSDYTEDQVEFGAPLAPARELGKAMGLDYFCVTDHSYDLDDSLHSYLKNDPALTKWKLLQKEVESLNSDGKEFVVVRGEEVSCRNAREQNVHLLLYGQREFVHGSGDGAEKWFHTRSEHSVQEVVGFKSREAVAFAAHAKESVPLLQRLLLRRGEWGDEDLFADGMSGLQIINGRLDEGFRNSYRAWIRLLLSGRRIIAIAGNDAHGNFNRFRQIGIPFISIREEHHQIFGMIRTGVCLATPASETSILGALKDGNCVMTDGPVVKMTAQGNSAHAVGLGGTVSGDSIELWVEAVSSPEFGQVNSMRIIVGKIGDLAERTAFRFEGVQGFNLRKQVIIRQESIGYVRVEVLTSTENSFDQRSHFCFTNPIWINAKS